MKDKVIINDLFRFRMLMVGVYLGICVSSTYGFSIFTELLKEKYGFNQVDITTISTVGNCVGYLSFFAGAVFDFAGPKVLMGIASVFGFVGFLLYGLAFKGLVVKDAGHDSAVIQFCIFTAIFYVGCPALDVASLMPLMLNFPLDRGYILIIQKTLSGLGSSVLMSYFNGFFRPRDDYAGYAFFLAAQIFVVSWIGAALTWLPPYFPTNWQRMRLTEEARAEREATLVLYRTQVPARPRLYIGVALVAALLVFMAFTSIVPVYVRTNTRGYIAIAVVAIVIVAAFALMALPLQLLGRYRRVQRPGPFPGLGIVDVPSDEDSGAEEGEEGEKEGNGGAANAIEGDGRRRNSASAAASVDGEDDLRKPSSAAAASPADIAVSAAVESDAASRGGNSDDLRKRKNGEALGDGDDDGDSATAAAEAEEVAAAAARLQVQNSVGDPQYTRSFWRNLLSVDLWLMWFGCFGMWGSSTVFQANAAQIYRSKNYGAYDAAELALYVALIGVGSAVGRFFTGGWDMWVSGRRLRGKTGILVTVLLPVAPIFDFIAYLLFAVIPVKAILLPFLIGAIGSGLGWGMGTLSLRVMYARDVGKHYNFMFSSGFVCVLTMNRFMFGNLYDAQARKEGTTPSCNRPVCIRTQMFILMGVNIMSSLCSTVAHIRFSRHVARERRRLAALAIYTAAEHDSGSDNDNNNSNNNNTAGEAEMSLSRPAPAPRKSGQHNAGDVAISTVEPTSGNAAVAANNRHRRQDDKTSAASLFSLPEA